MDIPAAARTVPRDPAAPVARDGGNESAVSAVAWAAVFAGAVTAAAIAMVLLGLGSGLGLASVSPWSTRNPSLTTFTAMMAIWLIVVHWIASGLGGYMTGRLRTKWVNLHTDEVFFRDTAHGFLAWAVAMLMVAALGALATTVGIGAASAVGAGAAAGQGTGTGDTRAYAVDTLFRTSRADPGNPQALEEARAEATRILSVDLASGEIPAGDRSYLAEPVAARTGIAPEEARKRVDDTITKARDVANQTRKAAASASIITALAMLLGAFVACVAAAYGGRLRDDYP
jgi:hypothetical protein